MTLFDRVLTVRSFNSSRFGHGNHDNYLIVGGR